MAIAWAIKGWESGKGEGEGEEEEGKIACSECLRKNFRKKEQPH